MGCNTAQKEIGGKELLLKACIEFTALSTTNNSEVLTKTAHGLKVGDLVKFSAVGTNTTLDVDVFYFVVEVPTADTFKVAATKMGTAIEADATSAVLAGDFYRSVGGLRSKSFSFNTDGIDITNQESDEWTTLLDKAGIRSFEVSGDGVYTSEQVFQAVFLNARNNKLMCLMFIDVKTSTIFEGCYKITSLEVSGDYDGEGSYSISASSSGPIRVETLV